MNRRVARKLDFSLHEAVGSTQPQWKIHIPGRVQAGKRTSRKHGGRRCISIVPIRMGSLENVKFPIVGQVVLGTTTEYTHLLTYRERRRATNKRQPRYKVSASPDRVPIDRSGWSGKRSAPNRISVVEVCIYKVRVIERTF